MNYDQTEKLEYVNEKLLKNYERCHELTHQVRLRFKGMSGKDQQKFVDQIHKLEIGTYLHNK